MRLYDKNMAFAQKFRLISSIGAILFAAALFCSCGINGVPPMTETTDSETDDAVDTSQYVGADVDSVDLIEVTDPDAPDGCHEWNVQLVVDDLDPTRPAGTAWYSNICVTDDENNVNLSIVKLTDAQVSDFHAMLDQVQINTWNPWLDANTTLPDDESTVMPSYMVSVLVDNTQGIFYDAITVLETMPPNWDIFIKAMNTITGHTTG